MTSSEDDPRERANGGRSFYEKRADSWSDILSKWITIAVGLALLIGGGWTAIAVLNGGFKLGSQVAIENLTDRVGDLTAKIGKLTVKVDEIPRPSDFSAADAHLARIDSELAIMINRFTDDEVKAKGTDTRVDGLQDQMDRMSGLPTRQPRRRDGN